MTLHFTPEDLILPIMTHVTADRAAATVDAPATDGIDNGLFGAEVLTVAIAHETVAASHTLTVSILHKDPGGSYAIATDAGGNALTLLIPAAAAGDVKRIRVRCSRLKRHIAVRSVVVGASNVMFGIEATLWGLDRSSDALGIAGWDLVDLDV